MICLYFTSVEGEGWVLQVRMGVRIKVLDPTPGCPAACVAEQTVGSFRDADAVRYDWVVADRERVSSNI